MNNKMTDTTCNDDRPLIHESVPFGILLAIVGGFLDAYTYIGRGGVLANAQTGNIVFLGISISNGEWEKSFTYILPIIAFVIGVFVSEMIKNNSSRFFMLEWVQVVLILEMFILFLIGLLPRTISNHVVTVTISFVASLQTSAFRKLVDAPYATVMCTGNLRVASQAAYTAVTKKDRKSAIRAIRFLVIILSFFIGVMLGGVFTSEIGPRAVWCAAVILALAVVVFYREDRKTRV